MNKEMAKNVHQHDLPASKSIYKIFIFLQDRISRIRGLLEMLSEAM